MKYTNSYFFNLYKTIVIFQWAPSGPRTGPRPGHVWASTGPREVTKIFCKSCTMPQTRIAPCIGKLGSHLVPANLVLLTDGCLKSTCNGTAAQRFFYNLVVTFRIFGKIFLGIFLGRPLVFEVILLGLMIALIVSGLCPVTFWITQTSPCACASLDDVPCHPHGPKFVPF